MKNTKFLLLAMSIGFTLQANAQDSNPQLHVNPRWKECSFQLDKSLTQSAWKQFAKEAGAVVYFRPLVDAKPMGARRFEVSLLQWKTAINDTKDAWNDTFVHPDSTHWLVEGPRLPISGLTARMGVTDRLDVAVYITKSPGANYGFFGGQVQYGLTKNRDSKLNVATRASFMRMYGPDDVNLTIYGTDLLASKEFTLHERWLRVSPYAGVSAYLSCVHEKSTVTDVSDERVASVQTMIGVVAKVAKARVAMEYNLASVNTVSIKLGVGL